MPIFKEKSDIAAWHDQKHGDFEPETGITYAPGENEYNDKINLISEEIKESKNKESESAADIEKKHIKSLVKSLSDLKLEGLSVNDKEQKKLLDEKIKTAKTLILDVLESVESYDLAVRKMNLISKSRRELEGDEYRIAAQNADSIRRAAHDALISKISIANRFLRNNFGVIEQAKQEEFEETETLAGRKYLEIQRITLPINGVCPDNINLSDRDSIGRWAYDIFDSLTKIKKEASWQIKNEFNKNSFF